MKNRLRNLSISSPDVKCLRILIHGPIGAGKSSFVNTIGSIFKERMTSGAIAAANTDYSFTTVFQTHYIRDGEAGPQLPFAFCDIMGLENEQSKGARKDDLVKILQGHIKDGFEFNPISTCSEEDPHYNKNPCLNDRIHCLVSVIPADIITFLDEDVIGKMKEVREKASKLRIPQVAVLTKVDETCRDVSKDLKLIYNSKWIKKQMQECSNRLGIAMNCIFPVKNYSEEIHLKDDVDVLMLSALENILNFANDHVSVMGSKIGEGQGGPRKFGEHTHHPPQAGHEYKNMPPYN